MLVLTCVLTPMNTSYMYLSPEDSYLGVIVLISRVVTFDVSADGELTLQIGGVVDWSRETVREIVRSTT